VSKIDEKTTGVGKNVAVFPTEDVCLIFRGVVRKGFTTVTKTKTGPEPPLRRKIKQYYRIKTTAEHSPPIEIRIILPCTLMTGARLKLWRWYPTTKQWKDITKRFSLKHHLIIGRTDDRLESMFGVT
jgi:hypothetical protein